MANLYHKNTRRLAQPSEPTTQLVAITEFLKNCRSPALLEYGEPAVNLNPGEYALEIRSGRLFIEAWAETRSLSRHVLTIERQAPGILDCTVQRFGGKAGKLSLLDLDRPQTAHKAQCGERQNFAEQFRRMLFRQFPGWSLPALSCGMDLQRSFSSVFPRAALRRGNQQIAVLACGSAADESALLTYALIWHDHLEAHSRPGTQTSLALFLPDRCGNLTAHRLKWLNGRALNAMLFRYNSHGSAGEVDPADLGNLQTRVGARSRGRHARLMSPAVQASERALEHEVRSHLESIEASLVPDLVHDQVIAFAAGDRDVVDLLAISRSGRLAVLELKASEDIHLPLQALDYWMRIRWHAERGELRHLFPGVAVSKAAPQLLLVAPAMAFHSANACVLRYFSPEIEVERVGLNSDWPRALKVTMRLRGSDAPISHGSSE